ncbi:MAG: tetratricopeptide repeat protein [Telluria sp.]
MIKSRIAHLGLVVAALGFTAATPVIGLSVAHAAETVRPEIGAPLQNAQKMMKSGNAKGALAELRKLDNVSGKTPNENYLIERVRAAAASSAGDYDTAARSFENLIASGKLSGGEKAQFSEGLIGIYMRARDFGKANAAIERQLKDRDDPKLRAYLIQNYISMGKTGEATRLLQNDMRSYEKSGRTPPEDQLQMLSSIQNKSGDKAGYINTVEKLAAHYPKESYWLILLNRISGKPGFSQRLSVDVLRLRMHHNMLKKPADYMELSQLVLRDGAAGEGVKIINRGYKEGILGVGPDAARHQRLKDLAEKNLAETKTKAAAQEAELTKAGDKDGLVSLGYALVQAGDTAKGLAMMESAIKSGGLKRPDDAKLRLGQAYAAAGKKSQAVAAFKSVGGKEGAADLARYYVMSL